MRQAAAAYQPPPAQISATMIGMPTAALATRWASMRVGLAAVPARGVAVAARVGLYHAAEASLALAVGEEGALDLFDAEVGPVGGGVVVLRVGRLPEEEVREPHLAGGADHQVGVRQAGRRQVRREELLVDPLGRHPVLDDPAHGVDDLLAAAVVEGDVDGDAGVVFRELDRVLDAAAEVGRERVKVAQVAQAHAVLVERLQLTFDEVADQADEGVHLSLGPAPVLGGEGVKREDGDLVAGEGLDRAADVLDAGAVPRLAREAAL